MSKTVLTDGSIVTPTFLNALNNPVMDGANSDGHGALVQLTGAANVQGVLPMNYYDLPKYQMQGLITSIANPSAYYQTITVQPGCCRDSTDRYDMVLTDALAKDIIDSSGVAWASFIAGPGGGVAPGSATISDNIWMYVFLIKNTSTGIVDVGFDSSLGAANLAALGYNAHRRIASVHTFRVTLTNAIAIKAYRQIGNKFLGTILGMNIIRPI
jgi:hypothetical protein